MTLCTLGGQATPSGGCGSRRARRCGVSTPGTEPFYPRVGGLCWAWERPASRCPGFLTCSKPSSFPVSGVKRNLIAWLPLSPVLPADLLTFLVRLGTPALPRVSADLEAPGACIWSWGCWLLSPQVVQLWPFAALWAGRCVQCWSVSSMRSRPRVCSTVVTSPLPLSAAQHLLAWLQKVA